MFNYESHLINVMFPIVMNEPLLPSSIQSSPELPIQVLSEPQLPLQHLTPALLKQWGWVFLPTTLIVAVV